MRNSSDFKNRQEWGIVAVFYSALHRVNHLHFKLDPSATDFRSHDEREVYLKDHLDYAIYLDYRFLFDASISARYKGRRFNFNDVATCIAKLENIKRAFGNLLS
ncbi:MAG: hypothetical protein JW941_05110 [Candidatus Coatesbacteria bacterium]|nr:hypothetical protein [Candidatus Coatesbacteria bacterium]